MDILRIKISYEDSEITVPSAKNTFIKSIIVTKRQGSLVDNP